MNRPRMPLYLVVDVADQGRDRKRRLLTDIIDGLRNAARADDARIVLVTFAEQARLLPPTALHELSWPTDASVRLGRGRSYTAAFDKVRLEIEADSNGDGAGEPVVVFVTDGRDGSEWASAFDELVHTAHPTVVPVVFGHADPALARRLGRPDHGPRVGRQADVARVVVDTVLRWACRTPPGGGHRRIEAPAPAEWTGSLIRFAVGDPGTAAQAVRPLPDPEEWNQRDTVLDGVTIVDAAEQPIVDLRAASVRGHSHRHSGIVRQDDYSYRRTDDGRFLVCAVSDGVSSGRLSHRAAALVARQGCELLAGRLREVGPAEIDWPTLLRGLGAMVIDFGTRLIQRSRSSAEPGEVTPDDVVEQMAATAVFAIVELEPDDQELPVHICSVGDSSVWVLRRGTTWEPVSAVKDNGKIIATSETPALPRLPADPPAPIRTALGRADVLVLMTDGLGDPLGDGTGPVGRFLASAWCRPPLALEFAAQVDFSRRSHDDDRTALAIWPDPSRSGADRR
jgi:protein phosphatase 2C-like protein